MSGGGIGGTLGGLAGAALAPETGGLSLLIPALTGAAGGFLGGKLTGDKNPLMDALLGGVGGGLGAGLGNGFGGIFDSAPAASGAAGAATDALSPETQSLVDSLGGGAKEAVSPSLAAADPSLGGAASSSPSLLSRAGNYILKNPLQAAQLGSVGLSAIDALTPKQKVDVAQNRANVLASDPNFSNASLPKYSMQNTATPYSGNWYTYGETPQTPLYNAQPQPLARGGMVKGYAAGGMPPAMPNAPQGPSPAMPSQSGPQIPVNPLTLQAAHHIGVAIGKHLKNKMHTPDGQVQGEGGGQDDVVPARLSQGEYVVPADVVSHLGDGTTNAGGKALDHLVKKVRHQKAVKGFPPKAKNPLSYLPKKAKA